jgi:hypothetical protein
MQLVRVQRARNPLKKLEAVFDDGRVIAFGAAGYGDYIRYHRRDPVLAAAKRRAYLKRHGSGSDPAAPRRDPAAPRRDPAAPRRDPAAPRRDPAAPRREDWTRPDTPGSLARWILWESPDLAAAVAAYRARFGV